MTPPDQRSPSGLATPGRAVAASKETNSSAEGTFAEGKGGVGYFRWAICALLLFGTTKNYMDRQVLSVLKVTLQHDLRWDEIDYSNVVFAFQTAYALGMVLVGRLVDRLGTRLGYMVAMVFWSVASMGHAIAGSITSFATARFALGLGEAGVFPASIKAVAEWFPKKERALATGIFNAGTNFGAILTTPVVALITARMSWRWAFVFVGALGFVWLIFWLVLYWEPAKHPRCSKKELEYIRSNGRGDGQESTQHIRWLSLLPHRQTWAFVAGKFLTDPIWWFYLFWAPGFLQKNFGLTVPQLVAPITVLYIISDVGSVAGGWLSSSLSKRGARINTGRKAAMLICAASAVPVVFASYAGNMWTAVLLIGLAAAGHQGFSANLYTISSDMFPNRVVGSVMGIGGMAGAIGGMLIAKVVGYLLQWTGSYRIPFFVAGSAYFVAVLVIHLLAPRLEPAALGSEAGANA
ncbi:MAG: MFS transporter [Acidobacteria bacterium]|nr:MAG: MFS transporter [Acidobacteriota bacterium]